MSRYADKRSAKVPCAIAACAAKATHLRMLHGRPDWFCPEHAERFDKQ